MSTQAPIVTLTMNPALDVSSSVDRVVPQHKLRCDASRFDPGGGGVNVSRAIHNLGGHSLAIYPLGGPTGQSYRHFIDEEGIASRIIAIEGNTRESFTINETATGTQFRFVLQGPALGEEEWRACLSAVAQHLPEGGYLVASGSLPPGAPDDLYAMLASLAGDRDVRVVVDAAGSALSAALDEGVFLIKPSSNELAELLGAEHELGWTGQEDAARSIVAAGRAEAVAVTLGDAGALLVTRDASLRLTTPVVEAASAVGAGDAFLAGLVLRLAQGRPIAEAFRTAVAAGSATALRPGTGLCRADDVARLMAEAEA
jgi:6-phosphofructokinase 2